MWSTKVAPGKSGIDLPTLFAIALAALWACGPESSASDGDATDVADVGGEIADAIDVMDEGDAPESDTSGVVAALRAFCGEHAEQVEERIDVVLGALTLAEKAALMHGSMPLPLNGTWETHGNDAHGVPGFRMIDGPRGASFVAGKATAFPVAMARGATWNPELERAVGEMIGAEARLLGADTLLAPTVNILRHPRWGRAQETYGEDPFHMGMMGAAFVQGVQEHVMAVVKHYAANSIENTRLEVDVQLEEHTLREIYLPHFRRIVIDGNVAGVMTAYNRVNGDWASESRHLVRDILRGEWGFAGFTVSDFLWGTHNTVPALEAGLDVEMPVDSIYGTSVVDAVESGEVDVALVDDAVRRILRAQWCFGESLAEPEVTSTEGVEALALAREAAVQGMVLLENRDGALPIACDDEITIALVGSLVDVANTGDGGSSRVRSSDGVIVTPLAGLEARVGSGSVVYVAGALEDGADRELVAGADVVIAVVGYTDDDEGEAQIAAGDRKSLELPEDDRLVLAEASGLNERVVAVVVGGGAFTTDGWGDAVEALIMSWYSGARGGDALADVICGDRNFSGRLPITFARLEADYPPFDNESLEVQYGYFHGYRLLQRDRKEPLYPFGFGLGYTTFTFDESDVRRDGDDIVVDVQVTNTGDRSGVETVQVYVAHPRDEDERAPRDLRAFARVELEAGESGTATARFAVADLAIWSDSTGAWDLVPGTYRVEVGPNVEALPLSADVTLP